MLFGKRKSRLLEAYTIYIIIHNFHTDMDTAFDGFRSSTMSSLGTITYSGTLINNGFGLNAANGKFTAPKNGKYSFHFRALANAPETYVKLLQNGIQKAATYRMVKKIIFDLTFISR